MHWHLVFHLLLIDCHGKANVPAHQGGFSALQADDLGRRPAAGRSRALARRTPGPPLQGDPDVHPSIAFHPQPRCIGNPGLAFLPTGDSAQQPYAAAAGCGHTGGGPGAGLAPILSATARSAAALRSSAAAAAAEAEAAAQAAVEGVLARGWG